MRLARIGAAVLAVVTVAAALAAARPAPAFASSCSITQTVPPGPVLQVFSIGSAFVEGRAFCNDGVGWRITVDPQYESGGSWHSFNLAASGNSASRQLPNEACGAKDHFTNDSAHDIEIVWGNPNGCGPDTSQDHLVVTQDLSPDACNQNNLRLHYIFRNAANGNQLLSVYSDQSTPQC